MPRALLSVSDKTGIVELGRGLVARGMPGELVYQPVKLGEDGGRVYVEVHDDVYRRTRLLCEPEDAGGAGAGLVIEAHRATLAELENGKRA